MDKTRQDKNRNTRLWIVAIVVATIAAGTFLYDMMMAPKWMRDFGLDMAAKATIVSVGTQATAFSTMKGRPEPDSPYICMVHAAPFSWDRVYFVASGGNALDSLENLDWDGGAIDDLRRQMASDQRYQLIVFAKDNRVIEQGYYFTLWADLAALGRPEGFNRQDAVFQADSNGEVYTLTVAKDAPANACAESPN